jgi:hydrogenase nickel incorporation protein HypB
MVHSALHDLNLDGIDVVFIENVGNLVCPASFDLGQHLNVTLLSTPEGHDKPAKYPVMFRAADLMVITKADLLQVLDDFDPGYATSCLRQLASRAPVMELSAKSGSGVTQWTDWVQGELEKLRRQPHSAKKASGDAV